MPARKRPHSFLHRSYPGAKSSARHYTGARYPNKWHEGPSTWYFRPMTLIWRQSAVLKFARTTPSQPSSSRERAPRVPLKLWRRDP
jgi:hypothetical protein